MLFQLDRIKVDNWQFQKKVDKNRQKLLICGKKSTFFSRYFWKSNYWVLLLWFWTNINEFKSMLGLVDYGSDSESEEAPTTSTASTSVATTTTSSTKPNLILPKASTSSLSLPPPKSTLPTKKSKGPVRILLDLPPPSSSISNTDSKSNDEPVKKKLKFTPGGSSGGGLSGLASMLPAPKYESTSVKLEKALSIVTQPSAGSKEENGEEIKTERTISTAFVPYSLAKGKKPVFKPSVAVVEEVDFFGLGKSKSR